MTEPPAIVLVRHGATEWSASGRHTGRSDVPLSPAGEAAARALVDRLPPGPYDRVWTSPTRRARDTARLAGFVNPTIVPDLAEWDYGDYEGLTTAEIQAGRPGWNLFATAARTAKMRPPSATAPTGSSRPCARKACPPSSFPARISSASSAHVGRVGRLRPGTTSEWIPPASRSSRPSITAPIRSSGGGTCSPSRLAPPETLASP